MSGDQSWYSQWEAGTEERSESDAPAPSAERSAPPAAESPAADSDVAARTGGPSGPGAGAGKRRAQAAPVMPPSDPAPYGTEPEAASPADDIARVARGATASDLSAESLLKPRREVPHKGWRAAVFRMSRGAVNPGPSTAEVEHNDVLSRVRTPVVGCRRVAVISAKGGVGKTTTAAALGATLAAARGDRIIAIDANPDLGTLALRFPGPPGHTVRELLQSADTIGTYADVRAFTSQGPSRLEVLASDTDPAVSDAFSEQDYRDAAEVIGRYYNVMLTDSGTGLLHSAMRGILALAHSLVIVAGPAVDGARSASATLDWLEAHGLGQLVSQAVVIVSTVRPGSGEVDLDRLEEHFAKRVRAVLRIPYDAHLAAGATIELDRLQPATREAYVQAAAAVVDGLATAPEPASGRLAGLIGKLRAR